MNATELVVVRSGGDRVEIVLNQPARRNALSEAVLRAVDAALMEVADSSATGVVLSAEGPVFSAGHDFRDVHERDHASVRELLALCTRVMWRIGTMPQVVVAKVQGLATAAGCQLVASCDLAIAARSAGFALPGGKGGWFCHTPAVPVARSIGRKRLMEMALTGDAIDADTAAAWGLVNYAVEDHLLDSAVEELLARATRGSRSSKALGKQTLRAQFDRPEVDAYALAIEVMAAASQTPDAIEGRAAFLEKRSPGWNRPVTLVEEQQGVGGQGLGVGDDA